MRRLSTLLLLGLLIAPSLFGWWLLRRGYSNQLRLAAFTYAAFTLVLGFVRNADLGF